MFLQRNRLRLLKKGFIYPRFCGEFNHVGLAALAMDDDREDPLRLDFAERWGGDLVEMRCSLAEAARLELADGVDAIFSNEHCHSRLTRLEEVRRLKAFLDPHFDRIDVCVYLRRQDRLAVSLYATYVRSGGERDSILPPTDGSDAFLNYEKSLSMWSDVFGKNNIYPVIFQNEELIGGSIIDDFCARWKIGEPDEFQRIPNENESMSCIALDFLRKVNPRLKPVLGPVERIRGPLAVRLGRIAPGSPPKPARAEAQGFLAMFADSNEVVRSRFFPTRETLFDESVDDYPDAETPRVLAEDDVFELAARLHEAAMLEKHRLEHEIALREAVIAALRHDWRQSESAARTALAWMPTSAEAQHALSTALLRQNRLGAALAAARQGLEVDPKHEGLHERVAQIEGLLSDDGEIGPPETTAPSVTAASRR
jgi:hypothetical protein